MAAIPWPDELFSLTARPGHLRLFGRESIGSHFKQALVARRQQAHCYTASTRLEAEPRHYQQMAGLVCYYNSVKLHYLYMTRDETHGRHLRVISCLPDTVVPDQFTPPVPIPGTGPVELRVDVDEERLRFAYRLDQGAVAVAAAGPRRECALGRSDVARRAELHGRVRGHGLSGSRRHGHAGRLRLLRVSRTRVRRRSDSVTLEWGQTGVRPRGSGSDPGLTPRPADDGRRVRARPRRRATGRAGRSTTRCLSATRRCRAPARTPG